MQTWADIKDVFFPAMNDTEANNTFVSNTQAVNWANKALWEMAQHTEYLDSIQETSTAVGTMLYAVGTSGRPPIRVVRVEIDDERILPVRRDELRRHDREWMSRSGQPTFYLLDENGIVPDTYFIGLWYKPDSTAYTARIYYKDIPQAVSDANETYKVQAPKWAVYGVLWSMLADAHMASGHKYSRETAAFYRGLFEDVLERLRIRSNKRRDKSWVMGGGCSDGDIENFWSNLPLTIPEP